MKLLIIKERLGRIGQIYVKNISFKDGILRIEIEEKWTIFPVPMITQSGTYKNRGFVLYEDNFLGTLGTFAPGISWSNSILNYLIYYQDESLFSPIFGIKFLGMKKSEIVTFERNSKTLETYESRNISFLIAPNFLYKDQVFKLGPIYNDKTIYNGLQKSITNSTKGIFVRHHWNAYQTTEVMYEGFVTTYDLYFLKSNDHKYIIQNEASINWNIPTKFNFINFGIHGFHSNNSNILFAKNLGGEDGYRGYNKASLPVSQNIGALFQYQHKIYAQLFLSPFYEINRSRIVCNNLNGKLVSESTLGIGLRYYFKKISIPAVMVDFARNIEDHSDHFHLNIGLSI